MLDLYSDKNCKRSAILYLIKIYNCVVLNSLTHWLQSPLLLRSAVLLYITLLCYCIFQWYYTICWPCLESVGYLVVWTCGQNSYSYRPSFPKVRVAWQWVDWLFSFMVEKSHQERKYVFMHSVRTYRQTSHVKVGKSTTWPDLDLQDSFWAHRYESKWLFHICWQIRQYKRSCLQTHP